ncbi:hypothetical protein JTB14_016450 [Gonioctena quinquepunctata]|nr:hypothetical protein JTB14_016450 [Gonioctena quinquepunctata]
MDSCKMASNNYLANVPKLHGRENYEEWSFAMENFLVLEGLSKCIDGTETENELVAKAKAKVVLSLNPSLYVHVELENCSSMAEYVNQVIETSQKLSRTGLKLDTSLVGSLLLAGLPDIFAPMVMALEHSGIGTTTDTIKSMLLDMQLDGGTNSTGGAFAIKDWLLNQRELIAKDIMIANDSKITVKSSGEVDILTKVGKENFEIEIQNAQLIPELATNLLSISSSRDVHIIEKERNADSVHFFVEENTEGNDPNNYQEVYSNEDSSSESSLEQSSGELVFSEEELSDGTYVPEDEESLVVPENWETQIQWQKLLLDRTEMSG